MRLLFFPIILLSGLLLSGCTPEKNTDYFLQHPEKIKTEIHRCRTLSPQKINDDTVCMAAKEATFKLTVLLRELMRNPQGFGSKIIAIQNQIAKTEQAIQKQPDSQALTQKLKTDNAQYQQLLAIIRLVESPR